MARIIKNGGIAEDNWQTLVLGEGDSPETVTLPAGEVLFPLAVWLARQDEIAARRELPGLLLQPDERVEDIAGELGRFAVIAVNFPKFVDGRGYSTAALLRQRHGYRGELRAVGDILHDQLFYLRRVGFDAFALRADKNADYSLEQGFATFSESYQTSTDQPLPYFRRRGA